MTGFTAAVLLILLPYKQTYLPVVAIATVDFAIHHFFVCEKFPGPLTNSSAALATALSTNSQCSHNTVQRKMCT